MKTILQLFTKYKYLLIVILAAVIAVADLANFGIPPTHDGEYHVMRFWQFWEALSDGNLYPRWAADFNNGFGVPLFNYVYPLPNYVASFFHTLGFGFIDSFKLNMAAATIFGGIFFYLWTRKYWGDWGGVVSSIFYTFSPYHLLDIYVRGSVGEVWSLAIAPVVLWAYLSFSEKLKYKYFVLSSVLLALLIYAHNILALVFFSFFILYSIFLILNSENKSKFIIQTILICFLGLGLSAPFWLPAIVESRYVAGLGIFDPTQYFPQVVKLIYSSWGYGFAGPNIPDQMSTQIGIANLFAIFESVCILLILRKTSEHHVEQGIKMIIFFLAVLAFTIFLITPYSAYLWKTIPFTSFIQFPWRLLSVVILCTSFLAGSLAWDILYKKHQRVQYFAVFMLILFSVGFSIGYIKAPFYHKRSDSHYLTRANFTYGTNSPGNLFNTKWLSDVPPKRQTRIGVLDGEARLKLNKMSSTSYSFDVSAETPSEIVIHTAYFPGWQAKVNEKDVEIKNVEGRMVIKMDKGSNEVKVWLGNTPIQNISCLYFIVSIILLIVLSKHRSQD